MPVSDLMQRRPLLLQLLRGLGSCQHRTAALQPEAAVGAQALGAVAVAGLHRGQPVPDRREGVASTTISSSSSSIHKRMAGCLIERSRGTGSSSGSTNRQAPSPDRVWDTDREQSRVSLH